MTKKKPIYEYEVYCPVPYCEVYIVRATSKKEARELFNNGGANKYDCVGEVSSRRRVEFRGDRIK